MIRQLSVAALVACLAVPVAWAEPPGDVAHAPSCKHCGMDRDRFGHSRMTIEYEDGKMVGTCSLHCTALELALSLDGTPKAIKVADMGTRQLVDAEAAVWVLGGSRPGVMTKRAKWAFAERAAAEAFVKEHGGTIVGFEDALRASYDDMYQDVKMIREKRKAMKAKAAEAHH